MVSTRVCAGVVRRCGGVCEWVCECVYVFVRGWVFVCLCVSVCVLKKGLAGAYIVARAVQASLVPTPQKNSLQAKMIFFPKILVVEKKLALFF